MNRRVGVAHCGCCAGRGKRRAGLRVRAGRQLRAPGEPSVSIATQSSIDLCGVVAVAEPSAAPRAVRDLANLQKTASAAAGQVRPSKSPLRAHLQGDVTAVNPAWLCAGRISIQSQRSTSSILPSVSRDPGSTKCDGAGRDWLSIEQGTVGQVPTSMIARHC
jgi:hypothetical protein